jgi:glutamine---fructose-6-phosphate transaminase (isomerizing)
MTQNEKPVRMLEEIREAPQIVARQLERNAALVTRLAAAVRERQPSFAVTVARGTSDQAAAFLKYAFENHLGLVTSSANPSTTTLYGTRLKLTEALVVTISQSGRSPDVVNTVAQARAGGALTVAIVNKEDSPLAEAAEFVLPMHAGVEQAVAATKTFIASLSAALHWLEAIRPETDLHAALGNLPRRLETALGVEPQVRDAVGRYRDAEQMITLARGLHYPMAMETALKLKETCVIHAESFSTAEFAHGPIILAEAGLPIIGFQARDATASSADLYREVVKRGAELTLIGDSSVDVGASACFETPDTGHIFTDPLGAALVAYLYAGHLSLARGLNPDAPRQLQKVTMTL